MERLGNSFDGPRLKAMKGETADDDSGLAKCSANEAMMIHLIHDESDMVKPTLSFNPEYTNQVFHEDESIVGYEDLSINFYVLAGSLDQYMEYTYTKKHSYADNIDQNMKENLSLLNYEEIQSRSRFAEKIKEEKNFRPIGSHVTSYNRNGEEGDYEVYRMSFETAGFEEYSRRMQVFVRLFIDGGSFIDNDTNWNCLVVYRKVNEVFTLVGFVTSYNFWLDSDHKRSRISQCVILPPFQRKGHGNKMLEIIYSMAQNDPKCIEITVEDPAWTFQIMRLAYEIKNVVPQMTLNEKQENQVKTEKSYEAWKIGIKELKRIKQMTKINMKELNKIVRIIKFFVMDKSVPALCNKFKDEIARELNQSVFVDNTFKKHMIYIEDEEEKISLQPQMFRTAKATSKEENDAMVEETWNEISDLVEELRDMINDFEPRVRKIRFQLKFIFMT